MKDQLLERLRPHGQEHLLRFWDELDESGRRELADQIREIDFDLIVRLCREQEIQEDVRSLAERATAPPAFRLDASRNDYTPDQARRRGESALRDGKVGAVLVAGGQGTRLGFDPPKGLFPIGPVSGHSLFQILFEKLRAVARRYGQPVPLYLMTSPATHTDTVRYLDDQQRFGLPPDDVRLFCQGTMPAVDAESCQLLLDGKSRLSLSPDGHGGMLRALDQGGLFDDFSRRGLELLFYMQVDNPLVRVCDPEFLGYHLLAGSEMSTQVVEKLKPREHAGNVVLIDDKVHIIEYSDLNPLPDEIVLKRSPDGTPVFWAGSTAVHVFDVAFLDRMRNTPGSLPFHYAKKQVPYLDDEGRRVEPDEPNAVKFERFIFDLLPRARHSIAVEVDRQRTFAPVKNASDADTATPETARAQMIDLHRQWLRAAGADVAGDTRVEISPLFALDEGDVKGKIQPGTRIEGEVFFTP